MSSPAAQIYEHFENITDPRLDRGCNHPLIELIFVACHQAFRGHLMNRNEKMLPTSIHNLLHRDQQSKLQLLN